MSEKVKVEFSKEEIYTLKEIFEEIKKEETQGGNLKYYNNYTKRLFNKVYDVYKNTFNKEKEEEW